MQPAEPEQIVSPSGSVMVINVLLNVALICAIALTTFLLIFFLLPLAIISEFLFHLKLTNKEKY